MPYKDPKKNRQAALERKHRYRQREHNKKYGPGVGDMRGRHGNHASGPGTHRWNEGITHHRDGYLKVQVGVAHPLADPNGYAYLHHLVWYATGGSLYGVVLHHVNEIKTDNRIENLAPLRRPEHNREHPQERNGKGQFAGRAAGAMMDGREWKEFPA